MAKRNGNTEVTEAPVSEASSVNHTLTFRRTHPKNRCSYGIAGNAGIVVFDIALLALASGASLPPTITVDVPLALPKLAGDEAKAAKAQERAAKAEEKARKAQERAVATAAKAAERQAKAQAALEKAKAQAAGSTASG